MKFKNKMKVLREELNMTLDTLAQLTGISKSYLWQIENTESNPSAEKKDKIAHALGMFFGGDIFNEEPKITMELRKKGLLHKIEKLSKEQIIKLVKIINIWSE